MDQLLSEKDRLDGIEDRIKEEKKMLQIEARERGYRKAMRSMRKIDPVFTPRRLSPDDAKVMFHPIDYIVFNGMNRAEQTIKNIILLDRDTKARDHRQLQRSIEKVVDRGRYEWLTLRVQNDGSIKEE
jgi:predicted Holliday junction resolvase-like endonuclease